ncbi:MAG: hypothetical protein RML46_05585 [Anaerolineae bacterium]|nr:hypothetical protein [Anaerolineae bacterium]
MKKLTFWGVVALMVLATLACSLGGKATPQPPEATPSPSTGEPTATPVPPSAPTEEAPPPEISSDVLQHFRSYRARFVLRHTVEGGAAETTTIEQEETREPAARRMVITVEGGETPGTIEFVQIGDMAWMCTGGECVQTQISEENLGEFGGLMLQPEEVTASSEYRYVGQDTVNGIRSRHYSLDVPQTIFQKIAEATVTAAKADLWVADEPGTPSYVTRLRVEWKGQREDGTKVSGDWTYEIYDVNEPFTIQPPEGAPTMPEDIPIYPQVTEKSMAGNLIMFSTSDSAKDVAEFYRNEMPGLGWTAGEEGSLGDIITQEWTKNNRKVSLMITPREEGGCTVMITVEGS